MKSSDLRSRVAPKRILLATDFSPASEAALPHALNIAGHYGSKLYVAHVICPEFRDLEPSETTATIIQQARGLTQQKLEPLLSAGRQKGVSCQPLIGEGVIWDVLLDMIHKMDDHIMTESDLRERTSFELGFGPTAEAILKFASDRGVDLIVMSVRRMDPVMAAHLPKPDTACEVVRTAPCPVLTVR